MSNKFSKMPNIPIPLSRFPQDFEHSTSMFHGDLIPVHCFECVPGDKFNYKPSELLRMSTPIVPLMSNIECHLHAVFVPLRLVWDEAEKFYGDPSNHDTVSSITPVDPDSILVPAFKTGDFGKLVNGTWTYHATTNKHCVTDYLGKDDILKFVSSNSVGQSDLYNWLGDINLSCLKERAYCVAWNDHFRPSLLVPPILINKTSSAINGSMIGSQSFDTSNGVLTNGVYALGYNMKPFKVMKKYDYFTANTLSPQFGNSVALPLGTYAPIIGNGSNFNDLTTDQVYRFGIGTMTTPQFLGVAGTATSPLKAGELFISDTVTDSSSGDVLISASSSDRINKSNLVADLSNATAATINQIRFAFQVQKYLERSNYGSRYFEILNAHYGVTNPDLRLQRSLRLGSHKFFVNISQVLATNESSDVNLGQTGAVSVTGDSTSLFTAGIKEPGYIMILMDCKYDRSYSSGFLREDLRKNRFEFYSPEFANLGDQATKMLELKFYNESNAFAVSKDVFGYQEHWAEYRYCKNVCSGELKPGRGLDMWTLADDFNGLSNTATVPGYNFLKEDREALTRVLVTGNSGPDYILNYRADIIVTREIPLYSIPGLIDHYGAL